MNRHAAQGMVGAFSGNVQQLVSGRPRSTRPPIHGQDAEIVFLPIVSWQYVVNEPRPKRCRWSTALIGGLVGTFAFAGAIGAYIKVVGQRSVAHRHWLACRQRTTSVMAARLGERNRLSLDMLASSIRGRRGVGGDADAPTIENRRHSPASERRDFGVTGWQVGKKGGADKSAPPFFIQDAPV